MDNEPKFGLKHSQRRYRCTVCSWKGEGFGPGVGMFGTVHREHVCIEGMN